MNPLYEISHFELSPRRVCVNVTINQRTIEQLINRRKYEDWLDSDGRLAWEMNYSDHSGGHVQKSGKFSTHFSGNIDIKEYWELSKEVIHKDLYDYLLLNPSNDLLTQINNFQYEL